MGSLARGLTEFSVAGQINMSFITGIAGDAGIVVTTLIGTGEKKSVDGYESVASFNHPMAVILSSGGDSLLLVDNHQKVCRVHLPTASVAQLTQSIVAGLALASTRLSDIQPLIALIASYAATEGLLRRTLPPLCARHHFLMLCHALLLSYRAVVSCCVACGCFCCS